MLHEAQRTSAPSAVSVSIRTAVWMVICNEPAIRAPRSGCCGPNSSRVAIRPGISVSAMAISLRPQSARPMSLTTKSAADACVFVFADVVMGILFAGNSHPPRIEAEASFDYALAGTRRDGNKDIKIPLYRSFIAIGHATYRDFVADLKAARAVALSADN